MSRNHVSRSENLEDVELKLGITCENFIKVVFEVAALRLEGQKTDLMRAMQAGQLTMAMDENNLQLRLSALVDNEMHEIYTVSFEAVAIELH